MIVRKAVSADLDQLAILFDGYRVFYRKDSDINGAKTFLKNRLENGDSELFVCVENDTLLGFTQLYPLFTSTRMKKAWLLNDLFVSKEQRGKGISKMLITAAKELAKQTDAFGLMLETEKSNDIGNNLYPSAGFELNTGSNFYEWTCPK